MQKNLFITILIVMAICGCGESKPTEPSTQIEGIWLRSYDNGGDTITLMFYFYDDNTYKETYKNARYSGFRETSGTWKIVKGSQIELTLIKNIDRLGKESSVSGVDTIDFVLTRDTLKLFYGGETQIYNRQ